MSLPGAFEQLVLLAVMRLGDAAYGMVVRREIVERADRSASLGAVYATLDRLEAKGWVQSSVAEGGPERGGRPRRLFTVTDKGRAAVVDGLAAVERMRKGVRGLTRPAEA